MDPVLVMVVDDEPAMLRFVELTLVAAGFEVLAFSDPREALEHVAEGLRPDAVVCDVSMPGLDGFDFYKELRAVPEMRRAPFLFLTAMEDRSYMRRGMTLGADDYLTKPFQRQELVDAVRTRLARIEELRRPVTGTLRVAGLGPPFVEMNGRRVAWDSLKAMELLFYLLEHPDGATTFEVAEALWPGKAESRASSSFHTTLYRLRRALGEAVESSNRRYYLKSGIGLDYDVRHYRELSRDLLRSASAEGYARAIGLYRGDFLAGSDSQWIQTTREVLHADQLSLLLAAAEHARDSGDLDASTRYYQALCEHEPFSEGAWHGLAEVWELRGERVRAEEARRRFEELLA